MQTPGRHVHCPVPSRSESGPWDRRGAQGQLRGCFPSAFGWTHLALPSSFPSVHAPQPVRSVIVTFGPGLHAVLAFLCVQPQWAPLLFWGPGATRFGLQLPSSQELPPRRASIQAQARKPAQDSSPPWMSPQPLLGQGLGGEIGQLPVPAAVLEAP